MLTPMFLVIGVMVAGALLAAMTKVTNTAGRLALAVGALVSLIVFFSAASVRFIGADSVGIVVKNVGSKSLDGSSYIATDGEKGVQADVLSPGWHLWYWPFIYDVEVVPLVEVPEGKVGLIETKDGLPLDEGQVFAPEWDRETFQDMLNARYFLTEGRGRKGQQVSVLTPGKYRLNTKLYAVTMEDQTEVPKASVAVLKSNFGAPPSITVAGDENNARTVRLAEDGEKGIRADPLPEGQYPINTRAFNVTIVSTADRIVRFTADRSSAPGAMSEEKPISVRTSDGFTFPVDVRVKFRIEPNDAPTLIAKVGDDKQNLRDNLTSAVRAIFRNNAESVKALDYVNQRSQQETQSLAMLRGEMATLGATVDAVFIGDIGDEESLGDLLTTQRDREIAVQEQITFQEQQRAAEQQKELSRTQQEAEEERRLATARYEVQIAEQDKEKRIIAANAEAESIRIQAEAQADAFRQIADQIGPGNAALVELLKIVGERGINITPRVMVSGAMPNGQAAAGGQGQTGSAETTALIGTMLDSMMERSPNVDSRRGQQREADADGAQEDATASR
jgi:uncharacterized membrane protein YqiK